MSLSAKKQNYRQNSANVQYGVIYPYRKKIKRKKAKKKNPVLALVSLTLLGLFGYYVCPYNFDNYIRPLYLNKILNRNLVFDSENVLQPTLPYLYNSYLFNQPLRVEKPEKSKELADINMISEMTETKQKLLEMFKNYPKLEPSVFVWEYASGAGFTINADTVYPSASIIKIPIACELMRKIDRTSKTQNPLNLSDKRVFSEFFRTSGSGNLQKTRSNVSYTIDYLANIMIINSDNSATNMILYEIGGVEGFNRAMRNLGLKVTSMGQWLPDLEGTNKITAREISKIVYNIDNPRFINPKYKNVLKEYLGNTRNTHLLKEKLPSDVMVLHKTGDIGEMLGDSGIVYTNNGKKYIVTILVKRPHNDYSAKKLIQDASLVIFEDIKKL